jgi:glycine dehydrogenase subunit 1
MATTQRPYIPHTDEDVREMLATIGASSIEELFREVPENLRVAPGSLPIPEALDEARLAGHLRELAAKNVDLERVTCFLGAGVYDRFVPATVNTVISRGEYLTSYTPYQPEVSQGYLQTIYEFQSMIAELYGMDLANASMYDGATSLAEAAIMASGITGRQRVVVSEAVHPHYRQVIDTYCWSMGIDVVTIPHADGVTTDYALADGAACVLVQYPNFFGAIEDLAALRAACDATGALMIVSADPTACALLVPPGEYGADIVTGEGQPLGVPMGLGGPLVGLFATKEKFVRSIPGRIVGRTREMHGDKPGFVMTLRTREQDIRREKATSNICTNEALMALANTVYLITLGKNGLRQVAETTVRNTQYAISELAKVGIRRRFDTARVFGEFVVELPRSAVEVRDALLADGILAGYPLGDAYAGMENSLLIAVTEKRTKVEIDRLVALISA